MHESLKANLREIEQAQRWRRRRILTSPQGAQITVDGRPFLSFCSNDYLGLANHPEVVAAAQEGIARYGVGSGAAHLVSGHFEPHHALEEELARFTGRKRAVLFSTGYMANLGIISALVRRAEGILQDRLNHASLIDGAILARARLRRYRHRDIAQVERRLAAAGKAIRLVVTDGVFSMDGDMAPLPALAKLCREHDAWLIVDDAHGLGVLGETGRGSLEHFGLSAVDVPVLMGTLGKAFGTFGAFVAGGDDLIETLIQQARTYIYTTAVPPAIALATVASLRVAQQETWRRERLQELVRHFRDKVAPLGFALTDSNTPIQPLIIGDSAQAVALSARLEQHDILVPAIRPPTVPEGSARLRITFSAAHELEHVDRLIDALGACA